MITNMTKNKVLTNEETILLIKKSHEGQEECKKEIIEGNIKLVLSIANSFKIKREDFEDICQIGIMGLMKAIENFDVKKEVRFSTYATHLIRGYIFRYLNENNTVKISRNIKQNARAIKKLKEHVFQTEKRELKEEEIAVILNLTEEEVSQALLCEEKPISINLTVNENSTDKALTIGDMIIEKENQIERWYEKQYVKEAIEKLEEKEKIVIKKKYFEDKTQNIIGKELGLSQAQISRIEKTALKKLKEII